MLPLTEGTEPSCRDWVKVFTAVFTLNHQYLNVLTSDDLVGLPIRGYTQKSRSLFA